jgi:hypothetical protein
MNIERLINQHGVDHCLFVTITFPDAPTVTEAQRRFKSWRESFLRRRGWVTWIVQMERSPRGRLHYHGLFAVEHDVRTGFDFEAYSTAQALSRTGRGPAWREATRAYIASASPVLRGFWRDWRQTAANYGLGRCELCPIRTNSTAVAYYLSAYLSKHIQGRDERDKGARTTLYAGPTRATTCRVGWNNERASRWRERLSKLARFFHCHSPEDLQERFGSHWCAALSPLIVSDQPIPDLAVFS